MLRSAAETERIDAWNRKPKCYTEFNRTTRSIGQVEEKYPQTYIHTEMRESMNMRIFVPGTATA